MLPVLRRMAAMPLKDPFAFAGVLIYLLFALVALFADQLAPVDPMEILFTKAGKLAANVPPGAEFPLGTTNLGRDIYAQLVYGTRSALAVGLSAAIIVATVGTIVGLLAGYFGGTTDAVLMRIADMALSLPFLPFVIVLTGFLGASTSNIVLAVAVLLWPNSARVIRSQVLTLRERAYVEAARVTGASAWRILFVHIAPNILPLSFVYAAIAIGWAIITEASVSFLGFGDSTSVSWGMMLQDAFTSQALSRGQYAWFVPPGICIILVVVAGFFISRGYEEVFMPRLRGDDGGDDPRGRQPADPLQHARRHGARRRRRLVRRARGPHRRPGGRIGLRQDHGGARHHGRAGRERPAGRRPRRLQGPGHGRGHDPPAALARHRLRAAKRHELARPGLHRGLAARSRC